jgi:hypothetical protein
MMMNRLSILLPLVALVLVSVSTAHAQPAREPAAPQDTYDLSWYSIDGGGATNSTGGAYSLSGSVGQPDAGALSGGTYTLNGGFWGGATVSYNVYMPVVMR